MKTSLPSQMWQTTLSSQSAESSQASQVQKMKHSQDHWSPPYLCIQESWCYHMTCTAQTWAIMQYFNPLIPNWNCLDFFMFKPDNSTITRNMHKVSLKNYTTGLPHQKCPRPRPLAVLTWSQACSFGRFSKSSSFYEGKKKEQRFTSRYPHKTGTRKAGDPYLLFCQKPQHSLHDSALRRAHHPPHPPKFWLCQKTYLKWEFPQEVVSKSGDA